jgi:hypothetical protein
MIVQLSRTESRVPVTPTALDLPLGDFVTEPAGPVVVILGNAGRVAGLGAHLPDGWSLRRAADLDAVRPGELVLFAGAGPREVAAARDALPRRARIVALVDDDAPAELVAGVLTAGADVCVRGGQPAILASHLVGCRRRQLTDRWATLEAALPTL